VKNNSYASGGQTHSRGLASSSAIISVPYPASILRSRSYPSNESVRHARA
jgi:hypothetical protein